MNERAAIQRGEAPVWTPAHIAQVTRCGANALLELVEQFVDGGDVAALCAVLDSGVVKPEGIGKLGAPLRLIASDSESGRDLAQRWGRALGMFDEQGSGSDEVREACASSALAHVLRRARWRDKASSAHDPALIEVALRVSPELIALGANPYKGDGLARLRPCASRGGGRPECVRRHAESSADRARMRATGNG
jgi:hypothetical protein